jgi:hypothetical protein
MSTQHVVNPTFYEKLLLGLFVSTVQKRQYKRAARWLSKLAYYSWIPEENANLYREWYHKIAWSKPKEYRSLLKHLADAWATYA